jgi:hypothetical protein
MQYVVFSPHHLPADGLTFPIADEIAVAALAAANAIIDTERQLAEGHDRYWVETPRDMLACALIRMTEVHRDSDWLATLGGIECAHEIQKSDDPFVTALFQRIGDFVAMQQHVLASARSYLDNTTITLAPVHQS